MGVLRVRDKEGNIKEIYSVKVASDDTLVNSFAEGTLTEIDLLTAKKIKNYAFYNDKNITKVNMPNVEEIGNEAFRDCIYLALTSLPDTLTTIGNYAFSGCKNLDVTIDNSKNNVTVGENAFKGCKSVTWLKE